MKAGKLLIGFLITAIFFLSADFNEANCEDLKKEGLKLYEKGDYKRAFKYFYVYHTMNPKDIEGPLYLGSTKLWDGQYDEAVYYFKKAAKINADDARIQKGISMCKLVKQEKYLKGAPEVAGYARKGIENAFEGFKKAVQNRDWNGLRRYSDTMELMYGVGFYTTTNERMKEAIGMYMIFVSSPYMKAYLDSLGIDKVVARGGFARICLSDPEKKVKEYAYLNMIGGAWKVVLFPRTISTRLITEGGR